MHSHNDCPSEGVWTDLIRGSLSADTDAQLSAHLDVCDTCRARLDSIATESGELSTQRMREALESAKTRSIALDAAIAQLKAHDGDGPDDGSRPPRDESFPSLDFLEPSEDPDSLGRIGPYEILEAIGHGAFGIVVKGFDAALHRIVAIKVLAPQLASSVTARKRFLREAQAAAAVSHPHVVTIHAVDEANGLPYLVMQCVKGMSLQERLNRDGPLGVREILRIGMQTASGLAAAHAQGMVHRDIKPANILLENGVERVKITDFGLARAIDDASLTESGVVPGTPQYMAPEQARGEDVDHRADLFSLGSVLFAMCCGRPPFRGTSSLAVVRRVADERPRRVDAINEEIPSWLADIVERLHEPSPSRRYASASEVERILERYLAALRTPGHDVDEIQREEGGSYDLKQERHSADAAIFERRLSRVRRRSLAAAAIVLCALVVTEVTGTTGVVDYVATVLRIRTPTGTLVVELEDPNVEVSVEGQGEQVSLAGIGPHTIHLRPGRHRVLAQRGEGAKRVEWLTVTRGERRVLRVHIEPEEASAASKGSGAGAPSTEPDLSSRPQVSQPLEFPQPVGGDRGKPESTRVIRQYFRVEGADTSGDLAKRTQAAFEVVRQRLELAGHKSSKAFITDLDQIAVESPEASLENLDRIARLVGSKRALSFHLLADEKESGYSLEELSAMQGLDSADVGRIFALEDIVKSPIESPKALAEAIAERIGRPVDPAASRRPFLVRDVPLSLLVGLGAREGATRRIVLDGRQGKCLRDFEIREHSVRREGDPLGGATEATTLTLELDERSGAQLEQLTRDNIGRRLAILFADRVVQIATIRDVVSRTVQISGRFSSDDVQLYLAVLEASTLPVTLVPEKLTHASAAADPGRRSPSSSAEINGRRYFFEDVLEESTPVKPPVDGSPGVKKPESSSAE